jgi:hypothetical protein
MHEFEPTSACCFRTLMPSYRATYAAGRQGDWILKEPKNVEGKRKGRITVVSTSPLRHFVFPYSSVSSSRLFHLYGFCRQSLVARGPWAGF